MKHLYVCLDCESEFDEPERHEEKHGLDTTPFETLYLCPACGSTYYIPASYCDLCDRVILDEYITTNHDVNICCDCYVRRRVGEAYV